MRKLTLCLLFFFAFLGFVTAQTIATPDAFLGYKLGSKFTFHSRIVSYFESVANLFPEQMKLEKYGETNEGRPLLTAIIASKENMKRIDAVVRREQFGRVKEALKAIS